MPSTYSTNLKIELQATGENSGTWGTITNTNLGTALEQAIVGYGNPNFGSDANLTLSYTDTNAAQAARALVLNVTSTGSLSTTRELIVPTIQKQYIVQNNTSGGQSITVKTSAGTGITVPNGRKAHLYVDGTNVIYMDDYVDINGGAIDGTPIGANSASTGSFTTLGATTGNITTVNATTVDATNVEVTNIKAKDGTAAATIADSTGVISLSANPTLSGGTANGVLYLNGSKVATSGSALYFDGTNLGVGTTSPSQKTDVTVNTATEGSGLAISNAYAGGYGSGANFYSFRGDGTTKIKAGEVSMVGAASWADAANTTSSMLFKTVNANTITEGMRLTSTGLGIGTSSPGQKLEVYGTLRVRSASQILDVSTPTGRVDLNNLAGDPMSFSIGSNEQMRLTSTGLGIGTSSPSSKLTVAGGAVNLTSNSSNHNIYQGTGWIWTSDGTSSGTTRAGIYGNSNGTLSLFGGSTISSQVTLDSSGNLGIGTSSPVVKLDVVGSATSAPISTSVSNTSTTGQYPSAGYLIKTYNGSSVATVGSVGGTSSTFAYQQIAANQIQMHSFRSGGMRFAAASSGPITWATGSNTDPDFIEEKMRLDSSGNLGIGTSNPLGKLVVSNSGAQGFEFDPANGILQVYNRSTSAYGEFRPYGSLMRFFTGSSPVETMRLDSSGNLGLGVTPSAWAASWKVFENQGGFLGANSTDGIVVSNNSYSNGTNWIYKNTKAASQYTQLSGAHLWYTAPSGTAGNAISFTQAMTLNASGQLSVGTTSANYRLRVASADNSGSTVISRFESANELQAVQIRFASVLGDGGDFTTGTSTNHNTIFYTNNTERARIDASGNFGVNITNPASYAKAAFVNTAGSSALYAGSTTQGVYISNSTGTDVVYNSSGNSAGAHVWQTGNTERARITSGGTLLVGTTDATPISSGVEGIAVGQSLGLLVVNKSGSDALAVGRLTNDGALVKFFQDGVEEGSISVSGNTVSYNAFAGSHWSQLQDGSKPDILRGTVMESINELCVWPGENNERLPKAKISDTAGSKKVYGVFMAWDNDWTETNDMYVTAVGAFICRVNGSVTVQEGDLLESNGDGTARVQADDIIRSSTIGKVTSTVKTHQYDDGSYCVPTVLYCG